MEEEEAAGLKSLIGLAEWDGLAQKGFIREVS
jgi:hypothetical protein